MRLLDLVNSPLSCSFNQRGIANLWPCSKFFSVFVDFSPMTWDLSNPRAISYKHCKPKLLLHLTNEVLHIYIYIYCGVPLKCTICWMTDILWHSMVGNLFFTCILEREVLYSIHSIDLSLWKLLIVLWSIHILSLFFFFLCFHTLEMFRTL